MSDSIVAIYDFEIFPFALGDVLTWNIQTAIRCEELGRDKVDIYLCADEEHPTGIQRGIIKSENFELFFNELFGAFSTHPKLGNIYIYHQRDELIARLRKIAARDEVNAEIISDYFGIVGYQETQDVRDRTRKGVFNKIRKNNLARKIFRRWLPSYAKNAVFKTLERSSLLPKEDVINRYFTKYIYSHEKINVFAARWGYIPMLRTSLGCEPDIDELITKRFAGKKIVSFHLRLRRLDGGYGGEHSYHRDSDFLEWYDFLKQAAERYPEVEFIALGRLQEKPLELLRLPNITSLRVLGMGLSHELALILKSDLFIGTSSGFAALANFSSVPYYITRMTPVSCHAYGIPEGADRLPFAKENQKLIYAQETSELLMGMLKNGLGLSEESANQAQAEAATPGSDEIDVQGWLNMRLQLMNSAATTARFFTDDQYRHNETAYLLYLSLEQIKQALLENSRDEANQIMQRLERNFPGLCDKMQQYHALKEILMDEGMDSRLMQSRLADINIQVSGFVGRVSSSATAKEAGWRPCSWVVVGGDFKPLTEEPQPAVMIQGTSANAYWHTERFISNRSDGKIIVRFDARNSTTSSLHRMYIFEDEKYHAVGEFFAESEWRTFEIPITTKPKSVLEFQIDNQADASQWLSIRDFHVINGEKLPLVKGDAVDIPMAAWETNWEAGSPCDGADGAEAGHDCMQWVVEDRKGYIKSPPLPAPGNAGLLIRFEARADRPANTFTLLYLWEGAKYRDVAFYAFAPEWREYVLLLKPNDESPLKVQIDYPDSVNTLSIRDFQAIPVDEPGGQ